MRLREDPEAEEFSKWLLDVGHGRNSNENGKIRIPNDMLVRNAHELIDSIYPGIDSQASPSPEYFLNRMILAPRNATIVPTTSSENQVSTVMTTFR